MSCKYGIKVDFYDSDNLTRVRIKPGKGAKSNKPHVWLSEKEVEELVRVLLTRRPQKSYWISCDDV